MEEQQPTEEQLRMMLAALQPALDRARAENPDGYDAIMAKAKEWATANAPCSPAEFDAMMKRDISESEERLQRAWALYVSFLAGQLYHNGYL